MRKAFEEYQEIMEEIGKESLYIPFEWIYKKNLCWKFSKFSGKLLSVRRHSKESQLNKHIHFICPLSIIYS